MSVSEKIISKTCPECKKEAIGEEQVGELFGWRMMNGKKSPQSRCKPCKNSWKPAVGAKAIQVKAEAKAKAKAPKRAKKAEEAGDKVVEIFEDLKNGGKFSVSIDGEIHRYCLTRAEAENVKADYEGKANFIACDGEHKTIFGIGRTYEAAGDDAEYRIKTAILNGHEELATYRDNLIIYMAGDDVYRECWLKDDDEPITGIDWIIVSGKAALKPEPTPDEVGPHPGKGRVSIGPDPNHLDLGTWAVFLDGNLVEQFFETPEAALEAMPDWEFLATEKEPPEEPDFDEPKTTRDQCASCQKVAVNKKSPVTMDGRRVCKKCQLDSKSLVATEARAYTASVLGAVIKVGNDWTQCPKCQIRFTKDPDAAGWGCGPCVLCSKGSDRDCNIIEI